MTPKLYTNFRTIVILPALSKIFEKVIANKWPYYFKKTSHLIGEVSLDSVGTATQLKPFMIF